MDRPAFNIEAFEVWIPSEHGMGPQGDVPIKDLPAGAHFISFLAHRDGDPNKEQESVHIAFTEVGLLHFNKQLGAYLMQLRNRR